MNTLKQIASFVADVSVCFLFAVLVIVAWPWIERAEDFKDNNANGGAK